MQNIPYLFCFPFAGGTADFYNELEDACGEKVHLVKLEYSGHGKRMREPLYHSFFQLTEDLYPQMMHVLNETPNADYALMGYSMGSIAAFDMLRKICADARCRKPKCVFLSAHQPQPIEALLSVPENSIDEWVKTRTIEFGGIDERLFYNESFWRLYLPIFKADYQMIAEYAFDDLQFQTKIPAVVFYSEEDTPFQQMHRWTEYFIKECEFVRFDGPHFFIRRYYMEMAEMIQERLNRACTEGEFYEIR